MSNIQRTSLSSKNQTVIPSHVRKTLGLQSGDKLMWSIVYKGTKPTVIAEPEPKSWSQKARGLGKHLWDDVDISTYISNLRNEWQAKQ